MSTLDISALDLTKAGTKTMVTEASTLRLPPGAWPAKLRITHNGATFAYDEVDGTGAHIYRHAKTHATIVVLND